MSFDYPDYLRIRQRSRVLGWLWLAADRGYYLGIVGAVLAFAGSVAITLCYGSTCLLGYTEEFAGYASALPLCLVALPGFVGLFALSAYLKEFAHRRSGIHTKE